MGRRRKNTLRHVCALIGVLTVLSACQPDSTTEYNPAYSAKAPVSEQVFKFGIHPLHNPQRLHEVFGPLMVYLNKHIPGVLFEVEASRNYAAYNKKLFSGEFEFALPNPYQTVIAIQNGYQVFGKMADDHNFKGIFIVRKDSGIKRVADLKGQAVSFPAPTALAATMLPQYFLYQQGIDIKKDIDVRYVGSQESSVLNVFLGNTVAGATWPPPWRALVKERPELKQAMQVIWTTSNLPNNGLVVRQDIDKALSKQVAQLICSLHKNTEGKKILAAMELSRFEKADNQTYKPVHEFLHRFNKEVRPIRLSGDK